MEGLKGPIFVDGCFSFRVAILDSKLVSENGSVAMKDGKLGKVGFSLPHSRP